MTNDVKSAAEAKDSGLSPAAQRALDEAEARRRSKGAEKGLVPEVGGRAGPEPTRYGDWEKGGIVSDF